MIFTALTLSAQSVVYNGISDIMLAQNDGEVQTESSTPRVSGRKKYEYREGKSPMIAAGLSLLLPGAGEFYGKDYIRSGIFFGIETAAVAMWYVNESDGDDKTSEFKDYAHANFSEDLYYGGLLGMTRNTVLPFLLGRDGNDLDGDGIVDGNGIDDALEVWNMDYFSNRDNWSYKIKDSLAVVDLLALSFTSDEDPIDDIIDGYNGEYISILGDSDQFTHNLPKTKTQQYYEMIGKYHQFACGWTDFEGYETDADGNVVYIDDEVVSGTDTLVVSRPKLVVEGTTDTFDYRSEGLNSAGYVDFYEDLRNEANIAYETGQNWLMVTLLNHVASAFDAAYVIKSKYKIEGKLRIENNDKAEVFGTDNYKLTYSINW